ncbi:inorganic phosphate transmembrane transporter [Aureococcus anophagefferens]|nr:inorganic phosphate transmembrane transporter [Aureococcus anophagefferens]
MPGLTLWTIAKGNIGISSALTVDSKLASPSALSSFLEMFSFPSMARGFGALLIITTVSEIMADRSTFEEQDFTWLIVCAGFLAFAAAFGIGANDVANSYATSVGSKAITIKQAVVLAAIFEFLGALLMGSSVSKTMRKGIADVECFDDNPGLLIYGMTCVILSVAIWLLLASYLEMPVSTTHSCVGGIIGMTLMARGVAIAVSWLLSPIASGLCAAVLYALTKYVILEGPNPYLFAKVAFPVVVFITVAINTCFIIIKGTKGQPKRFETQRLVREAEDGNLLPAIEVGCYVGLGAAGLAAILGVPLARSIDRGEGIADFTVRDAAPADPEAAAAPAPGESSASAFDKMKGYIGAQVTKDTHRDVQRVEKVASIHKNAKLHDAKAESFFRFVQVFTAIVASFSHGANDVANAMGPFSAAYVAYKKGKVVPKHEMDPDTMMWILALGGAGIVVGLATYGYKIMNAMGVKMIAITPSRGYCIELGAALVVIYGTAQGWPLSTTHCQVGAIVAVGLFEGTDGVNLKLFAKTCFGWIITLVVVGCSTAVLVGPSPEPLKKYYCDGFTA